MYLRGRDAIGEGDDLEFEHHLVTIEDFKGTVVQDLTPLFSPAVQRKQVRLSVFKTPRSSTNRLKLQQIKAGNALLNSPTPNQANCHGPWGPSRYSTPAPQSVQQRSAVGPPKTPTQRRPIGVPGLTLQQAARQGINYPAPTPERYCRPAQFRQSTPANAAPRAGLPPQGLPPISHQLPQPNLPPNPIRASRPRQNPEPPVQPGRPLPFHVSGQPGPGRQSNQPPPSAPTQRPLTPSPQPNHVSPYSPRPRPNPRPSVAINLDADSGLSPDARHPREPLLPVFIPTYSESVPLSRKNRAASGPVPPRANKRPSVALNSNSEIRPFSPPTKRKSSGTPVVAQPGVLANKNNEIGSESDENGPVFEPLVSAGILRLDNTTSRKRNKLLCQRPLNMVRGAVPSTKENPTRKLKTDSGLKPFPPPEDVTVIGEYDGLGDVATTTKACKVNHRKSSNTSLKMDKNP